MKTFNDLRKINVNEHVERKGQLNYLSWTWAVDTLLQNDPMATWEFTEPTYYGDTMMVHCQVTALGKTMRMHLPVMDNRNNAVKSPDARKVSDAMMRCLAKCIATFGIGLYIFSGEDLPSDSTSEPPEPVDVAPFVESLNAAATVEDLRVAYVAAVKACKGDNNALQTLEFTKDNRKTALEQA